MRDFKTEILRFLNDGLSSYLQITRNIKTQIMERRIELDILRGLLICLMVVDHTPNPLRELTDQPLGFVSAAEGFVFLSAYLLGAVSQGRIQEHGLSWLRRFAFKRALNLYLIHLGMLLFLFITAGFMFQKLPGFANFILRFFETPGPALLSALLLLYQPPLFDILPMYIVFLVMTPLAFSAAQAVGWNAVMGLSGLLWVSGFIGTTGGGYPMEAMSVGSALVIEPGAFHMRAWQFIWIAGLALGRTNHVNRRAFSPLLVVSACLTAVFFFCWRNPRIPISPNLGDYIWMLDKWQLGPLRLLNFFALVVLLRHFGPSLRQLLFWLRPLSGLGRNSLPVFSAHVCFAVLAIGFIETYQLDDWACTAIVSLQLALLFGYSSLLGAAKSPLGVGSS